MIYNLIIPVFLFIIGIYFSLAAFGIVKINDDQEKNESWLKKYGVFMRILGPLMVALNAADIYLTIVG